MRYAKTIFFILLVGFVFFGSRQDVFAADVADMEKYNNCMDQVGDLSYWYTETGTYSWVCEQCGEFYDHLGGDGSSLLLPYVAVWFNNGVSFGDPNPIYFGAIMREPKSSLRLYARFYQCGSVIQSIKINNIRLTNQSGEDLKWVETKIPLQSSLTTARLDTTNEFAWSDTAATLDVSVKITNSATDSFYKDVQDQSAKYNEDPVANWQGIGTGYHDGSWHSNVLILGKQYFDDKNEYSNISYTLSKPAGLVGVTLLIYDPCEYATTNKSWALSGNIYTCCNDANQDAICDDGGGGGGGGGGTDPTPSDDNMCPTWQSSTRANSSNNNLGTSSVIAAAKNNTSNIYGLGVASFNWATAIGNYGTHGSNDTIYAKPGDVINYQNCYYGGEQRVADTQAMSYDSCNSSCDNPTIRNEPMKNIYSEDFNNHGFKVTSENFGEDNDEEYYFNKSNYGAGKFGAHRDTNNYTIDPFDVLDDNMVHETNTTVGITYADIHTGYHSWTCDWDCWCECDCPEEEGGGDGPGALYDNGLRIARSQSSKCGNKSSTTVKLSSLNINLSNLALLARYSHSDRFHHPSVSEPDNDCTCGDDCSEDSGCDAITHSHSFIDSTIDSTPASATITVTVPYNFINTATISLGETSSSIAYAGETIKINTTLKVNTRRNNTTNGTYATIEEASDVRIYTYSSTSNTGSEKRGVGNYYLDICSQLPYNRGNCTKVNNYNGELNDEAKTSGATHNHTYLFGNNNTYNIYDIPAGEYFCAVTAVYPYTTNGDTDVDMMSDNHSWYVSAPACKVVNKKPSFQIWGGNVYSSGNIKAQYAAKNTLSGYISYTGQNQSNKTIFGSWAEFAVIPNTLNNFLSSGAATGYTTNNGGNLIFNPGGNRTGTSGIYCKNSPLTIMNKGCSGNAIPENANMIADTSSKTEIYNSLAVPAKSTPARAAGTWLDLSDANNFTVLDNPNTRYTYVNGDAYLKASRVIPTGVTHIVYASGNIILGTGLQYSEGPYTDLSQIPQYIFYADKDIDIEYDVSRIDGWLISEETINTCTSGTALIGVSDSRSATQLRINGAVVAKKINFGRTYGASFGNLSGIPAEIINLNTTHFLWSSSNTSSTPTLRTVYTKELAPRY